MAIIINDNLAVNVGKPIDSKYLNGQTPWASIGATNAGIPLSYRYTGLTINILGVEYWYKNGITDPNLIEKKYDSIIPSQDFVTGATNIGYFSGQTGVQTLPITNLPVVDYNGNYNSIYNNYYRGTDGKIHVGAPSDGILRRGYVKTTGLVKSWLWNEYTGDSLVGWNLVDGNIADLIGTFQAITTGATYYTGSSQVYTQTGWTTGTVYNNGSDLIISTVLGSLTTGATIGIGGPVYINKIDNVLNFRTLQTLTSNLIKITSDEAFVYLSGSTGNQLLTASNGLTKIGQDVRLGGTLTGTTTITDARATALRVGIEYGGDYSTGFTNNSLVSKLYVDNKVSNPLGGERIYKIICQINHGFAVNNVAGWSGNTYSGIYNKPIADGTYDGEVLGVVTKCFNADCFELTQAGYVTGLTPTLTMNCTYFLSATAGQCGVLTSVEPIVPNYISKSMLIAVSSSSAWILPYAGYVITSGVTGGPLVKNVSLPVISPYYVAPTDYYIGVGGGTVVVLQPNVCGYPTRGTVIVVADICGNACASPICVTGSIYGYPVAEINTCYGSLSFIYNGTCWNVVGFAPTPAP
jgi:hypothetical protein